MIEIGREFIVAYDRIQGGWIRFNGKGQQPDRRMGSLFDGYQVNAREELPDLDERQWPTGLDGKPTDPWVVQLLVPLVERKSGELFVFQTSSPTGRNAVGRLISKCRILRRKDATLWPVVKLSTGGFNHRDERIGFVITPDFPILDHVKKDGTKPDLPDATEADWNDEIGF